MPHSAQRTAHCSLCGRSSQEVDMVPLDLVRPPILALVRGQNPGVPASGFLCREDLNRYRARYVQTLLEEEKGELTEVEQDVVRGLHAQEILAADTNVAFERGKTFGERLADHIASFGGSWTFILAFGGFLAVWIAVNAAVLLSRAFDPYPFILLNLLLSCLAALQAPVIMMSQKRQEARDRLRAEHDYQVNLKAELEIRLLSERVDRLLTHQWQRLLEIQQVQVELMEQLGGRR